MDGTEFLQGLDISETIIKFQNPNYYPSVMVHDGIYVGR